VCWCAGVLVCWCAGVLVCWCASAGVCQCALMHSSSSQKKSSIRIRLKNQKNLFLSLSVYNRLRKEKLYIYGFVSDNKKVK